MWYDHSIFYQFSTLDFCTAPVEDPSMTSEFDHAPIYKITEWIDHLKHMGFDALYLCPVFESDSHGYDTRDYRILDPRLGSNEDFAKVVEILHENQIKVVIDGVFHHAGRGFWAFRDLCRNKEDSPYRDWFFVDFERDSGDRDGFYYEGWEGHYELVKLNLSNPEVRSYLLGSVKKWIEEFNIDGLRLDVAYAVDPDFLSCLRDFCKEQREDFFLMGETLRDNYPFLLERMDSVTNYQAYKGLWSSMNSYNLHEICHTIRRQQGELSLGNRLFNFLDNHDVTRIASIIQNPRHLYLAYGLLMAMPGTPCIYYGSEWGEEGVKEKGAPDHVLRPYFRSPMESDLTPSLRQLNLVRHGHPAFATGDYEEIYITGEQFVFARTLGEQRIIVALNISGHEARLNVDYSASSAVELITSQNVVFGDGLVLPPYSIQYWLMEDRI
ncbi:MAG: alpha-amylase family glycosyl hydrolase [Anaerovoracaceae bacterium]|jgi:cyclomaltodextrinase